MLYLLLAGMPICELPATFQISILTVFVRCESLHKLSDDRDNAWSIQSEKWSSYGVEIIELKYFKANQTKSLINLL